MKANAQGLSNLVQPLKVGHELCWVKHNAMNMYVKVEGKLNTFLSSALNGVDW
jgi:hypothetical protein